MNVLTPYSLAANLCELAIHELPGTPSHPFIQWALSITEGNGTSDEIPWCAASMALVAAMCGLPYSRSRLARSWLKQGRSIPLEDARVGFDFVVLSRGEPWQGHVGWFAGHTVRTNEVLLISGNQGNAFKLDRFDAQHVLAARRLGP